MAVASVIGIELSNRTPPFEKLWVKIMAFEWTGDQVHDEIARWSNSNSGEAAYWPE